MAVVAFGFAVRATMGSAVCSTELGALRAGAATDCATVLRGKQRRTGATRAMLNIVRRLNPDDPDPCNDLPEKPKGMHWTTYDGLVERYEGCREQWGGSNLAPTWQAAGPFDRAMLKIVRRPTRPQPTDIVEG